jgi:hypothetical protein
MPVFASNVPVLARAADRLAFAELVIALKRAFALFFQFHPQFANFFVSAGAIPDLFKRSQEARINAPRSAPAARADGLGNRIATAFSGPSGV